MDYRRKLRLLELIPAPLRSVLLARRHRREVERTGEAELARLSDLVGKSDVAVDIGCNLGAYARELSRLANQVIAFEPNPYLARFIRSLDMPGVEVRELALGAEPGTARLAVPTAEAGDHGCASLRGSMENEPLADTYSVPTSTLDAEAPGKVDFIKIDVEGYEEPVIDGAMALIARDKPLLLVEIEDRHNPGALTRICEKLAGFSYSAWFLQRGRWVPITEFVPERDQDATLLARAQAARTPRRMIDYINNFLFVPSGRAIAGIG